jgi:hypothetical protein
VTSAAPTISAVLVTVDIPGTQRYSARRYTLSLRPAPLAAAVHIIYLPCPDPNPASPRTAARRGMPMSAVAWRGGATRARQRRSGHRQACQRCLSLAETTGSDQGLHQP